MKNHPILIISILALSGCLGFLLSWYIHKPQPSTNNVRIIETYHYPASFVKQLKGDPKAGQKIFQEFCATCHAKEPIINLPAPRLDDKKTWKAFRKLGVERLLKITIDGVGAMPARGGCFECSDEQLRETIWYMLKESG